MLSQKEWNGLLANVKPNIKVGGTDTKRVVLMFELILRAYFDEPENDERRMQLAKLLRDTFQIDIGNGSVIS